MTQSPHSVPCPRCAAVLPPGANFCRRCGIGLTRPPLPPSVRTPAPSQARRTTFTTTKPIIAKKRDSGTSLLPLLLICVFALNALRAYQRNSSHFGPPRLPGPRYFTPPTTLLAPARPTLILPPAPTPSSPRSLYPAQGPSTGDELHWSDTPRWSPHRDARDPGAWHPIAPPRYRPNDGER
jgi:hypothetical protein